MTRGQWDDREWAGLDAEMSERERWVRKDLAPGGMAAAVYAILVVAVLLVAVAVAAIVWAAS